MDREQLKAALEALVFASDIPLASGALKEALPDVDAAELRAALEELQADYEARAHGVQLVEVAGGWIFRTKSDLAEIISRLRTTRPIRLSRPALETLSIVAYRQPVTRGGVEDIRGVDSGGVLRTLLEKRLIRILGRSEAVGNPLLYGTTKEFLQVFGLKNLTDLPTLQEFQELDEEARSHLPPDMAAAAPDPDEDAAIHEPTEADDEDAAIHEPTELDDEDAAINEPTELDEDSSAHSADSISDSRDPHGP